MVRINIIFFHFSIFCEKRKNRKMIQESEIISFFSFSNNRKKTKNSKISLLAVYSILCIFEFNFKIRKTKKWSIFLTIFFFLIFFPLTLKYVNMIRISNMSFFRFCWKNEKENRLAEVCTDPNLLRNVCPPHKFYSIFKRRHSVSMPLISIPLKQVWGYKGQYVIHFDLIGELLSTPGWPSIFFSQTPEIGV